LKLALVVSTPQAEFSALAIKDELREGIRKVAELGYDGVELAIRDPKLIDADSIEETVKKYNLEVPAIGTGQAYGEEGISFSDPKPEVRVKAKERIGAQIEFASRFGAQVIIGLIRGIIQEGVTYDRAVHWTIEGLRSCSQIAKTNNVNMVIEPINRYETNFINTLQEGIDFIEKVGRDEVTLMADVFHMNIEEPSIYNSLIGAKDYLTHIHFADSNRWAPGSGHLDFAEIGKTLKSIGYDKFISVEILPKPSPETCGKLSIDHLRKVGF
jgi:sugar phosphate isomerase/epimerase